MRKVLGILLLALVAGCKPSPEPKVVRVAVIGGLVMSGMWDKLSGQFEKDTGVKVVLVISGNKEVIGPAFREGVADVLTMHSSDVATDLVAAGYGQNMRPWARNELVILAPPGDPAGIMGWKDGAAALRRIAETRSRFVDAKGAGKRIIAEKLWSKAGIRPTGEWLLTDQSASPAELLAFAERNGAYVLSGRIPVLFGKLPKGGMQIAVEGDSDMQRPYVVIEANPAKLPGTRSLAARQLSDYLAGPRGQEILKAAARDQPDGKPLLFPITSTP
ncbi:MAG: substrate-binding domain-containing protein [Chthoniobacterales bacterium]|nr:substrate-binding domain-containing protein [Chthoniobacterales bacterium]